MCAATPESSKADHDRLIYAYMLTGVRGIGKTTTARLLARALNYKTNSIDKPNIDMEEIGYHCLLSWSDMISRVDF